MPATEERKQSSKRLSMQQVEERQQAEESPSSSSYFSVALFFFFVPGKNRAKRRHCSAGHSPTPRTASSQIRRAHTSLTALAPFPILLTELQPPSGRNRAVHLSPLLPPPSRVRAHVASSLWPPFAPTNTWNEIQVTSSCFSPLPMEFVASTPSAAARHQPLTGT